METKTIVKNGVSLKSLMGGENFIKTLSVFVFCFLFISITNAQNDMTIEEAIRDAKLGNFEGMYYLGHAYASGDMGVAINLDSALYWFSKIAEKYSDNSYEKPFGEWGVAKCYEIKGNYNQAFSWMTKAANRDYKVAQYDLGSYYMKKIGTEFNEEKSVYWLKKAAAQEYEPAIRGLQRIAEINQEYAIQKFLAGLLSSSGSSRSNDRSESSTSSSAGLPDRSNFPKATVGSWKADGTVQKSDKASIEFSNDGKGKIYGEIKRLYNNDGVTINCYYFTYLGQSQGYYRTEKDVIDAYYVYERYDSDTYKKWKEKYEE